MCNGHIMRTSTDRKKILKNILKCSNREQNVVVSTHPKHKTNESVCAQINNNCTRVLIRLWRTNGNTIISESVM